MLNIYVSRTAVQFSPVSTEREIIFTQGGISGNSTLENEMIGCKFKIR
jgi:hypothetical protein